MFKVISRNNFCCYFCLLYFFYFCFCLSCFFLLLIIISSHRVYDIKNNTNTRIKETHPICYWINHEMFKGVPKRKYHSSYSIHPVSLLLVHQGLLVHIYSVSSLL